MGEKESEWLSSISTVCNFLCAALFSKKASAHSFYIDSSRVQLAKEEAKKDPSFQGFVSTNDIVTSSYGNATFARVLLMAINLRGELSDLCNNDTGNYGALLVFGPHEKIKLISIRDTLQSGPPVFHRFNSEILPLGFLNFFTKISTTTSWIFPVFHGLKLDECEQMLHTPLCILNMVPFDVCIIYRPRAKSIAVCGISIRADYSRLEGMMPIGDSVVNAEQASERE